MVQLRAVMRVVPAVGIKQTLETAAAWVRPDSEILGVPSKGRNARLKNISQAQVLATMNNPVSRLVSARQEGHIGDSISTAE